MTEGWYSDSRTANYSLRISKSRKLPCSPTQSVALGGILEMEYYLRFQQKLCDDQMKLWWAGHQAQIISGLKCWAVDCSEGYMLAQAHLEERSILFVLGRYFGNAVINCFLCDYSLPVEPNALCGFSSVLSPLWSSLLCLGWSFSSSLCSPNCLCIWNLLIQYVKHHLHSLTIGSCSPSKQLGELLHGDPDGNRSSCLHHELHHWEEQKQPSGSCVVQYSQGAARK